MNRRDLHLWGRNRAWRRWPERPRCCASAAATRRWPRPSRSPRRTRNGAPSSTTQQFAVLRQEDTEYPGTSPLLHEKRKGNFTCAGCDLPLYSSETKFDSGTGWPSFWEALPNAVGLKVDEFAVHGPHRGALPPLRRPSRPRLRRRSAADRQASLHQRRRADLQAGRRLSSPAFSDRRRRWPLPAACASASRTPPAKQTARSAGRTRP